MPSSLQHEKNRGTREGSPAARGWAAEKSLMERANLQGWEPLPSAQPAPTGTLSWEGRTRHGRALPLLAHPQVSKAQSPSPREPQQSGLGDCALHWNLQSWKPHTRARMQTPHRGAMPLWESRRYTAQTSPAWTNPDSPFIKNGTAAH